MKPDQLGCFVDRTSGAPMMLVDAEVVDGQVRSGRLVDAAGAVEIPVREYIPRFVPPENYAGNFGLQWQIHRKTQLDSYNGATYSRDRLFTASGWERDLRGQRVLEAGSGAGRFTEVLASTGADVYTFDFSDAVAANYASNGHNRNVVIFQGDIYNIPFPEKTFDKVICLGVLQHTPDVAKTFRSLAAMVKPGGMLVVDAYSTGWKQMLHWKYAMRPVTKHMDSRKLYKLVSWYAPKLMPLARVMRKVGGRAGARLVPILDQSDKSVSPEVQRDWTILDTYDALSPAYDQPQSAETMTRWFRECGFRDIHFEGGAIGVHGRGIAT